MAENNKSKTHSWKYLGLILLGLILFLSGMVLWHFVDVLVLAFAIAYVSYPIAKWVNRKPPKRGNRYMISSFFAVLLITLPLIIGVFYGINFVMRWIIHNLPAISSGSFFIGFKQTLDGMGLGLFSERIVNEVSKLISGASFGISNLLLKPTFLVDIVIRISLFFVATFYFVYEGPAMRDLIRSNIPDKEEFLQTLFTTFDKIAYGLFVGHFFTSIVIALLSAVGFWYFLHPTFISLLLLVLFMFIVSFMPVIGPWLMYVPLSVWMMFFVDGGFANGVGFFFFGFIFLTMIPDFYLRPKLIRRGVEIHPFLIILGFFGGPLVMGAKGIIIGPLILGLAQAMVVLFVEKRHILQELIDHF